jgi:hypothetical protein
MRFFATREPVLHVGTVQNSRTSITDDSGNKVTIQVDYVEAITQISSTDSDQTKAEIMQHRVTVSQCKQWSAAPAHTCRICNVSSGSDMDSKQTVYQHTTF